MSDEALSQDARYGMLTTPAGANVLALRRFDGAEKLSQNFEFRIEALSQQANYDFNALLGQNLYVTLQTVDNLTRYFNGVLVEAYWTGQTDNLYTYRLVLRPWFWLLSLTSDCRIFKSMGVKDIIKQVFDDRGFSGKYTDNANTGSYPTLEYCVQYRETDLAFVSRLMEKYGIFYYFKHDQNEHALVMADSKTSCEKISGLSSVVYNAARQQSRTDQQVFNEWTPIRRTETGRWVLNDYNYQTPPAKLLGDGTENGGYEHDDEEMYDFPGGYDTRDEGERLAKIRLEADQTLDHRFSASGSAPSLYPGALVSLQKHPTEAENIEYLVVRASHIFVGQEYRSTGGESNAASPGYGGNYELTPSDRQFRAPLLTPWPEIPGVQSAVVVGKEGEEIDVDELGRVCVMFFWDRKKKASRRVRVSQQWAGNKRGFIFIPRIGDEVLVAYKDGDPDRPIVVGSVYNTVNKPWLTLPDEKNKSGVRTDSTLGHNGHNTVLFDDTAGSELFFMRAQKNMKTAVLNDKRTMVQNDYTIGIGWDAFEDVFEPAGDGKMKVYAADSIVLTVGTDTMPLSQIKMDQTSITLTVGPFPGRQSIIRIDETGITQTAPGGLTTVAIQTMGISEDTPYFALTATAMFNLVAPAVNIGAVLNTPSLMAGAAMVSGVPV
jgi:type VI secretion system secreted protein VgrG